MSSPYAGDVGYNPFSHNAMPSFILASMSRQALRQRRRVGNDSARYQRNAIREARRMAKVDDRYAALIAAAQVAGSKAQKSQPVVQIPRPNRAHRRSRR